MKKMNFLFVVLVALSCNQPAKNYSETIPVFNHAVEKAAILEIIENETDCFFKHDYEGWKENFVQKDYAFQAWSNMDGTYDARVGWKQMDERVHASTISNPTETGKSSHPWIEKRNMVIKFFSANLAYLIWDQYNSDKDSKNFMLSKDQRIMEKVNGKWKIASVSTFWDYKNIIPVDSINSL